MNYYPILFAAVFVPLIMIVLTVALNARSHETLVFSDYPLDINRKLIDIATARVREKHPHIRLDSVKSNGVVVRARTDWRPWLGERITITAEPKSIRIVSEGTTLKRDNLEIVRAELLRAIEWAEGRSPEEIVAEGLKRAFPGLV